MSGTHTARATFHFKWTPRHDLAPFAVSGMAGFHVNRKVAPIDA